MSLPILVKCRCDNWSSHLYICGFQRKLQMWQAWTREPVISFITIAVSDLMKILYNNFSKFLMQGTYYKVYFQNPTTLQPAYLSLFDTIF